MPHLLFCKSDAPTEHCVRGDSIVAIVDDGRIRNEADHVELMDVYGGRGEHRWGDLGQALGGFGRS